MTWLVVVAVAAIVGGVLWQRDARVLREAAAKIDASYRKLNRQPSWRPLESRVEVPGAIVALLDQWEERCRGLGFSALGRLSEHQDNGDVLGVRSVLLDPTRTIVAAYGVSHRNPAVSFRSFSVRLHGQVIIAVDAKSAAMSPPTVLTLPFTRTDGEEVMLYGLAVGMGGQKSNAPFADLAEYIRFQDQSWRERHDFRVKQGYQIDLETLAKLAPPEMSPGRLRRLHRLIGKLGASRAG